MDTNNWKQELQRLLELFERESVNSLKVIRRCFNASGLPFDEDFRKYFMKMSTVRLETSFDTVLYDEFIENQMPSTSTSNADATIDAASVDEHHDSPNEAENENMIQLKMENNADDPIEIVDTDDEDGVEQEILTVNDSIGDGHVGANALAGFDNDVEHSDGEYNDEPIDANNENGNEVNVKNEIKVETEIEMEMEDLPMIEFDPNKANDHDTSVGAAPLNNDPRLSISSRKVQKQLKRDASKRFKCTKCVFSCHSEADLKKHLLVHETSKPFKCTHCDYACRQSQNLKRHQKVHAHGRLIGVVRDPINGRYKCTRCDQRFTEIRFLSKHLTVLHKNNQRTFNCAHCLRRFEREIEKERHEIRCCNRRYECHLCKKFITKSLSQLQRHMRTHTGEKPFECKICNSRFGRKCTLKHHLNSIHCQK